MTQGLLPWEGPLVPSESPRDGYLELSPSAHKHLRTNVNPKTKVLKKFDNDEETYLPDENTGRSSMFPLLNGIGVREEGKWEDTTEWGCCETRRVEKVVEISVIQLI